MRRPIEWGWLGFVLCCLIAAGWLLWFMLEVVNGVDW